MRFRSNMLVSCGVLALSLGLPGTAHAQEEAPEQPDVPEEAAQEQAAAQQEGRVEDIFVTADRTERNLQSVPLAVTALNAEALESRGITDISRIADFAPNVTMDSTAPISGSSSALVTYIRGIGQSDYAFNFEPGVGLYVDGVYIARNVGGVLDLMDVARVEVLKGPQGTLFGRNAIGGAVNVVSRRPERDFGGRVEATVGEYNRMDFRGILNIPLADNIFTSIAFSSRNRDGYVHRIPYPNQLPADQSNFRAIDAGVLDGLPNGDDLGNQSSNTVRAQLLWEWGSRGSLLLQGDYTRTRENAAPAVLVDAETWMTTGGIAGLYNACVAGAPIPVCGSVVNGRFGGTVPTNFTQRTPYDNRFLTPERNTTYGNSIAGTALESWGIVATINYELAENLEFRSISAYRNLDSIFAEDADGSPLVIDHHQFQLLQEQWSQEFHLSGRMGRLRWLAGLYYFNESGENNDFVPLAGGLFQVFGPNQLENTSYAAFGQGTFNITDAWSVTLGARFTREEKEFVGGQRDLNALNFQLGTPLANFPVPSDPTILYPPGVNRQTFEDTSIRVGTEYRITDDVLAYVSYAEGFKAGGWDTRLTGPELAPLEFAPETASTVELGLKSEWFDRHLRVNVAAFQTQYENLQLVVQRGISPLTANAGESEIKGFELELVAVPTPGLLISGSYGYIDAQYTRLDAAANAVGIFLTNRFVNTPENQFSLAVDYDLHLAHGGRIAFHGDYSWRDETFNDAVNTPQLRQESYGLLGLSVRYFSPDDRWFVGVGATNVTDEEYIYSGFNQPGVGFIYQVLGRPREAYLSVGANF